MEVHHMTHQATAIRQAEFLPGRAMIHFTEAQVNIIWLEAVANCVERDGYFPLDAHDVVRLRELVAELKASDERRRTPTQ